MQLQYFILILFLMGIILSLGIYSVREHTKIQEAMHIYFDFKVVRGGLVGFNLDKDKMHFGNIGLGGLGTRKFTITNTHPYRERVQFWAVSYNSTGAHFMSISPSSGSIIEAGKSREFEASVAVPSTAAYQQHDGEIIIQLYKAWLWSKDPLQWPKLKNCFLVPDDLWDMINCR